LEHVSIPDFRAARVLVVGDVMLDRYWHGPAERVSPEAPVPVVRVGEDESRPGGAANVAVNAAALGAEVALLGATGDDAEADILTDEVAAAGVSPRFLRGEQRPTLVKLRVLSRNQQLIRVDFETGFGAVAGDELLGPYRELLQWADVVVLSDYGKGTLAAVAELIAAAGAAGIPTLVDPKGTDFARYRGATLITPNRPEFEAVAGAAADADDLAGRAERLRGELAAQALLVTRGAEGMTLVRDAHPPEHLATRAREVFDVTGAGDTVIATLAAARASGEDWSQAAMLANWAAGIVVGRLGTAAVSAADLRRAALADARGERHVLAEAELLAAVADAREHGERVVMTNGCFDLLHAGHVAYLEEAAALGDRLIVAVNDDASVARLKGEGRPVNGVEQRMAVLAGLAAVDWVVPFGEDTPARLIGAVRPDVLVKGGDYRPEDIAGYQTVTEAGGEVVVLGFREDCSTTGVIETIRGSGGESP
jgi:D-beta-D-heptose 7-phosphate kinase/D-beta-D-heptose 1-phosphate adenosyltransferase